MTWVVNSNTQITITAGAGEVTEGNIVVLIELEMPARIQKVINYR